MRLKEKYTWIKHIDFIVIDLLCLIMAFLASYFIRMRDVSFLGQMEWQVLLLIMCLINFSCMFIQSTYSGVLSRRYYRQFKRELALLLSQIAVICVVLFAFRAGIVFSRQIVFSTYLIYFLISQPAKYVRKKYVTKSFSFQREKNIDDEDTNLDTRSKLHRFCSAFTKRTIDIIAGIVGCVLLIPLTIMVYILNKFNEEDEGPVFYIQERIGKDGRLFKMFKYRSMVVDADEKLKAFLEENEDIKKEFKIYRKIKNDPRVTNVGKFLRKTSLDEFPQFINVLIGNMSLVGPRPYLPREKKDMGDYYKIIIKYKPGVTGLWQISGRSDVTFEDRLKMDMDYHENHSTRRDMQIVMKTLKHVAEKKGAV